MHTQREALLPEDVLVTTWRHRLSQIHFLFSTVFVAY
jgi:hypothetical protein